MRCLRRRPITNENPAPTAGASPAAVLCFTARLGSSYWEAVQLLPVYTFKTPNPWQPLTARAGALRSSSTWLGSRLNGSGQMIFVLD
jgi:hypothetical protein